ncbi:MAG: Usg family protein [Rhizobiales bacterium]|nr:Usg family protein [Hyphomicrobiales bacterium]
MQKNVSELAKLIEGYRLITAEILYHMPDHRDILQSYIWQDFDMEPRFPALSKFLAFWEANLDGPLHSVRIAQRRVIHPSELIHAGYMASLH